MFIISVIIIIFLEYRHLLVNVRKIFSAKIQSYVEHFTTRNFRTQREIRYAYLAACAPIVIIMLLLRIVLMNSYIFIFLYYLIILFLFMLTVQILPWKEEAKHNQHNKPNSNNYNFINTYATHFFAPLFWYMLTPAAIGPLCYLVVMQMSIELKNKGLDLIVYNVVVDKMLFYVNIVPYTLLYLFLAIAGDFEEVLHHILLKRKSITKSFYFLNTTLQEVVLMAIGKDKFQITPHQSHDNVNDTEAGMLQEERFTPEIKPYIIAVLYRASIFYLGSLILIQLVSTIKFYSYFL